ncbi:MAG: hypothetical protein KC912_08860 [Proteobacteria bacterium]|nr:hypothetical protein [Pseudomonadota bacterium]
MADPTPIRVLFLHGLEGHPNGSKVIAMREQGLDVRAPDMKMGLRNWRRENAAIRQLPRLPEVQFALLLLCVGAIGSPFDLRLALLSALAFAWLVARRGALFSAALSRSFDDCVSVAHDALAGPDFDVLVGSSWGGAVASELLASGAWSGPTILLAPAVARMHRWARRSDGDARISAARASSARVVIFHDPTDDVVPHEDSVALADGCDIELRSVDAGGHRLLGLLSDGRLAAAIRELADG